MGILTFKNIKSRIITYRWW